MTVKQLSPKRQKRKQPNMTDKLASALLHIRRGTGDDWLVKGELRDASAKEICAAVDFDHIRRWAEDGSNEPQNLQPLIRAEHREKSRKDTTEVAKGKRFGKKHADHSERVLVKVFGSEEQEPGNHWPLKPKRKSKINSRNTLSKEHRDGVKAWKERVAR